MLPNEGRVEVNRRIALRGRGAEGGSGVVAGEACNDEMADEEDPARESCQRLLGCGGRKGGASGAIAILYLSRNPRCQSVASRPPFLTEIRTGFVPRLIHSESDSGSGSSSRDENPSRSWSSCGGDPSRVMPAFPTLCICSDGDSRETEAAGYLSPPSNSEVSVGSPAKTGSPKLSGLVRPVSCSSAGGVGGPSGDSRCPAGL